MKLRTGLPVKKNPHIDPACPAVNGTPKSLGDLLQTFDQRGGALLDSRVQLRRERRKRCQTCRHRQGIPRERSGLVDGTGRCHALHYVPPPAVRRHGQASPDHLAEGREIGGDSKALARSPGRDPESRHHLVEDEKRARAVGELPQSLEEARIRRNESGIPNDGLDDDGADTLLVVSNEVSWRRRDR